jgi:hypothetical protein
MLSDQGVIAKPILGVPPGPLFTPHGTTWMTGCTSSQQLRPHASYLSAMLFEEKLNVQDKTAACTR